MKSKKKKKKQLAPGKLDQVIFRVLANNPKKRLNAKQIIMKQRLGNSYNSVNDALARLVEKNMVIHVKDGRHRVNKEKIKEVNAMKAEAKRNSKSGKGSHKKGEKSGEGKGKGKAYVGRVDQTRSGDAYIIVANLEEDIYVPSKYLKGAFHNDTVKVSVNPNPRRRRKDGKVVEIVKRSTKKIIGKIEVYKKYGVVHNDDGKYPGNIHVPIKHLNGAKDEDHVLIEITDWGTGQNKGIWGKVKEVLTENSASDMAMQTILLSNGFDMEFPDEVEEEMKSVPDKIEVTEDDLAVRRDFRKVTTLTIDPDTAKDFDDALSIQELDNGNIEIGIHIADVTHYVKPNTALDKEALERSTSVYLVDRVCPMLPEKLSNNLCSLMPHVDRFCFSAVFQFDKKFKVVDRWFGKGVIHSDRRFSYEEAQERLESGEGDYAEELREMNAIAHKLRKDKFKNGAIAFESDEVKFKLDENGTPIGLYVKSRKDAHMLVEDFMLLANKEVALFISKKSGAEVPFVYRVHDEPDPDKLREFAVFAKEMGVDMKIDTPKQVSKSMNALAKKAKEDDMLKMLQPIAIRTMAKAIYTTDNIGHYGLAFDHYAHFTSPIRRYADVLVHRILSDNLDGEKRRKKEKLELKCKHISLQEKKAAESERESIKYKQVEYLKSQVGNEFEARVSGMIERGIFVQLIESRAESLITFDRLGGNFNMDDNRLKAKSSKSGKTFKMGDTLKVQLISADVEASRIELEIVE
jgi:ribonuclease R